MAILKLKKVNNLADLFGLYSAYVRDQFEKNKADSNIAKTKTSIIRYALPEYGFSFKLDGNLSPSEMMEGLKFMEGIPIYQVRHLLEAQEQVFDKFGDRVSPNSRRVYRSALKKMVDWGKSQDWWQQLVETSPDGRTPTMLIRKKRVEHWHKLKSEDISPRLNQQLNKFSTYMTTLRQPCISESSCLRYRREILGALGWLHRFKGKALADLALTDLMPIAAIYDSVTADQVVALVEEYLEWMRANLGGNKSTLRFALQIFFYLAEYIHDEYEKYG